jgi:serine/threonine protein phosphatase PrpC
MTRTSFDVRSSAAVCQSTDGVTKALSQADVAAIMRELPAPARAAREIVERARRRGSDDDITCLVAELEEW